MTILRSVAKGLWRAASSPAMVGWLWLVNVVAALPFALSMASSIEESIGPSQTYRSMSEGFDMGWYGEFSAGANGLERTFTPTVVGAGAVLDNLEAWVQGDLWEHHPGLIGLGIAYALAWTLFLGGILDRYASAERFRLGRFLSTGGRFFFRFLRLAILSAAAYFLVYRISIGLFAWVESATRDATAERTVLAYTLLAAGATVALLALVNMVFDYAKIAAFREDRNSMLLAGLRGLRFVLSRPAQALGVYALLGGLVVLLIAAYAWLAPGAGQATPGAVVLAFLAGQAYLLARLFLRLSFYGGEMALWELAYPERAEEQGDEEQYAL